MSRALSLILPILWLASTRALATPAASAEDRYRQDCRAREASAPVVLSCARQDTVWRVAEERPMLLGNVRAVYSNVTTPGATGTVVSTTPLPQDAARCQVLERWEYRMERIEIETTCAELLAVRELSLICQAELDRLAAADPSLVRAEKTGEVTTCR